MPRTALIVVMLVLAATQGSPARGAEYTVGVVPQFDLRRIQAAWAPILERLSSGGGDGYRLVLEPDIPTFERALSAGAYDFAYMNPYHYVVASTRQGYRPLVRDIAAPLYGIVVVRRDSPITDVHMLDGKVVAFPAPNAMGAALIPRAEFARRFDISVRPVYVKSHTSAYMNALLGEAAAAGGIKSTLDAQAPEIREGLRILHETERHAPHPLAVHPRVPADAAERITAALLAFETDPAGRALLAEIPVKHLGPAVDADYEKLRSLGLEAFYVE